MMLREITIGRAGNCDINLDSRCMYASSLHGVLYSDGNQLMYKDCSRNGTLVNNNWVKGRAVPIRPGDNIVIAGRYPLSWNEIYRYFPVSNRGTIPSGGTAGAAGGYYNNAHVSTPPPPAGGYSQYSNDVNSGQPDIKSWSWGAFALYPIWGFFNGCWWAIFISIFFGWSFVPSIMFGVMGRRLAWENRRWTSAQDFEDTQHSWDMAGIILSILGLISIIFFLVYFFAILDSYSRAAFWYFL